jgi:hypothetical protein
VNASRTLLHRAVRQTNGCRPRTRHDGDEFYDLNKDPIHCPKWIVDVEDCINGAKFLAAERVVDHNRIVIRGGSAGGYTTLAALVFRDFFQGGASYYGISDVAALARETQKFESRYLDWLIGPYPQAQERYRERSPLYYSRSTIEACDLLSGGRRRYRAAQ